MGLPVRVPNALSSCPVTKCSNAGARRRSAPKQSRSRPLDRSIGVGGHGGGGGVSSGVKMGSGDDDDPEGRPYRHGGEADWVHLMLRAGAPVLALNSLISPNARASEPSAAQPLMDSLQQQDSTVRGSAQGMHTGATGTTGGQRSGEVLAIKRLLREAFADLVNMKQQLQDLMPRSEDADMVTPHAGAMVRPSPKKLAADLRYKAKAQLSGTLDFGCVLPWSNKPAANARERTCEALAGAGLIAGGPPKVTALLQSVWGEHQQQSLTARLLSASGSAGSLLRGPLGQTTHPDPSYHSGSGSSAGLQLDQLVFRQEVKPGLKVMVSALGGSLANLSRRLNPSADFGCTRVMRQGHDIPMVTEGGSGGATLMSSGPVSLSIGHFVSGGVCRGRGHHSLAQLSVHSVQRSTASLVLSHVHAPCGPPSAPTGSCSSKQASSSGTSHDVVEGVEGLRCVGLLAPSCSSPCPIRAPEGSRTLATRSSCAHDGSHESDCRNASFAQGQLPQHPHLLSMPTSSHLRLGVAGSTTVWDSMVLSGWHTIQAAYNSGKLGVHSNPQPTPPFKGSTSGIRVSSLPDLQGRLLAAVVSTSASPMRLSEPASTQ
ncbi:hypothetical protein DUNSADRAFT_1642, partial [Dunaliella salina]